MKVVSYILPWFLIFGCLQVIEGRSVYSCAPKTPERVTHVLDSLYPGPKDVRWSKKRQRYTAHFILSNRNYAITLDRKGKVLTTEEEISSEILPSAILEKFQQFYKSFKIVMILRRKYGTHLEYDIEIVKGKEHYLLNYNEKHLIRQYHLSKSDRLTDFTD